MPTSSEQPSVKASGLWKTYRLGETLSLGRTVDMVLRRPSNANELHAVADVTFEVRPGECFSVLGRNGSGKSTVLQIVAGLTVPTRGRLELRGTVLPLFEIAQAFHPELTGRENVVLFGTILGLHGDEIEGAMDEVAAFAEVERHMDTPMKRYSMGMRARLSFATAMRFPADIYIFDEVLAVVDDDFRERCHEEMKALARAGRTVLFVSHNMESVREISTRAMWLHEGRVQGIGAVEDVTGAYVDFLGVEGTLPTVEQRAHLARAQEFRPAVE